MVMRDKFSTIRKRESYADLLRGEVVPLGLK
jgi:hypothetical protein